MAEVQGNGGQHEVPDRRASPAHDQGDVKSYLTHATHYEIKSLRLTDMFSITSTFNRQKFLEKLELLERLRR